MSPMFLLGAVVALLLTLVLGLVRALLGPSLQDRMLAVQLLGTGGVALLLLMSVALDMSALVDVALVLALLAIVVVAAITREEPTDD